MSEPEKPTPTPGRCAACGATVPFDDMYGAEGEPRRHRRKKNHRDIVGEPCGPVITQWFYRLVVWVQLAFFPGLMKSYLITRHRPLESAREYFTIAAEIGQQYEQRHARALRLLARIGIKLEVVVVVAEAMGGQ